MAPITLFFGKSLDSFLINEVESRQVERQRDAAAREHLDNWLREAAVAADAQLKKQKQKKKPLIGIKLD